MKNLMKKPATPVVIAIGLGLILFANLAVWIGVIWNRSAPESSLQLTERELPHDRYAQYASEEDDNHDRRNPDNNAIEFKLSITNRYDYRLPQDKLEALGFGDALQMLETSDNHTDIYAFDKPVLLVLELNGPAHEAQLEKLKQEVDEARDQAKHSEKYAPKDEAPQKQLERKMRELKQLTTRASRLYIVDVGLDKGALRAAYPDTQRYAIVKAIMSLSHRYDNKSGGEDRHTLTGRVKEVLIDRIHVPRQWHSEPLYKRNARFTATVNFGQRLEPWISTLEVAPKEGREQPPQ